MFQRRVLVGLVGYFSGGGDHCLQGWATCGGCHEVPAGKLRVVIRTPGHSLELSMVKPLLKARISKAWFPATWFTGEIKAALIAAVGIDVILQCVQMNPVCVIWDAGGIITERGKRAWVCESRACQVIAARWPGQIYSWVWIFLEGGCDVSLKGGQITGSRVNVRVREGRASLPWTREAAVRNYIKQFWIPQERSVVELSTAVWILSYLKHGTNTEDLA